MRKQSVIQVYPHALRVIAKAWSWRRKLDSGQVATIQDIATVEDVTPVYVGRVLKLAYLAPAVLERLLIERRSPAISLKDLIMAVDLPWLEQANEVFGREITAGGNCAEMHN
ncbi:hypothetical protein VHN57_18015 [Sphingobium sp. WW5]|uniref:hypothetical protein n=1 Tax=unclassified Sphingobium TaxID=2611147 RepID=UPI003C1DDEB0